MRRPVLLAAAVLLPSTLLAIPSTVATAQDAPACGVEPLSITGTATGDDEKTYRMHPFVVPVGTTRIEVSYVWANQQPLPPPSPVDTSVVDLGLWDADGYRSPDGFRGWSGSREGRIDQGDDPVFVQPDVAARGYTPGSIEPGTWFVETGFATVHTSGLAYEVIVACTSPITGPAFVPDPVDSAHVADPEPGWFHADFHMHGRHSNGEAPEWDDGDRSDLDSFIDHARDAGLDVLPITDYVTDQHWRELGPVQRANPDLLVLPSREIITYFGHATVFGETPSNIDYRHGFEDVSLADIQADAVADGALFGLAHPSTAPPPLGDFCRGCYFELGDVIDWSQVTTIEVLTDQRLVDDSYGGGPGVTPEIENPFITTAVDLWHQQLLAGNRLTAVSGSDDKLGPDLGSSATAVFAAELSRAGIFEGLRASRAIVKLKGVADSPTVEVLATSADDVVGTVGDGFTADQVELFVRLGNADGQLIELVQDGVVVEVVPITGDDFELSRTLDVGPLAGPLGSFWRFDVRDPGDGARTIIANPVFVGAPEDTAGASAGSDGGGADPDPDPAPDDPGQRDPDDGSGAPLPVTGGGVAALALGGLAAAWALDRGRPRRLLQWML